MEYSLLVAGTTGGLQKQNPAGLRRRGLGKSVLFLLPDPRRRVCNDAYDDDYADDNSRHCTGRAGAEAAGVGHGGIGGAVEKRRRTIAEFFFECKRYLSGPWVVIRSLASVL